MRYRSRKSVLLDTATDTATGTATDTASGISREVLATDLDDDVVAMEIKMTGEEACDIPTLTAVCRRSKRPQSLS